MKLLYALIALVLTASVAHAAPIRCAWVDSTNTIKEYRIFDGACPPDIPAKDVHWLPAPMAQRPAHDPATQVVEGPVITVGPTEVTQTYTVRDKTAAELDADKEDRLNSMEQFILRRICDHESRIRVLEGKPAITWDQCRAALKNLLQ